MALPRRAKASRELLNFVLEELRKGFLSPVVIPEAWGEGGLQLGDLI